MAKMTRERARFLIVDAMADGWTGDGSGVLSVFHAGGLATDDDTTTWADVFEAADRRAWSRGSALAADIADNIAARNAGQVRS